ncbi:hypothetical protein ACH3XW_25750 [Acanthocheilonema viteae]
MYRVLCSTLNSVDEFRKDDRKCKCIKRVRTYCYILQRIRKVNRIHDFGNFILKSISMRWLISNCTRCDMSL